MRPLRVAFFTPNLIRNGVSVWFRSLLKYCDPLRIEWTGVLVYGFGQTDYAVCRAVAKHCPIYSDPPIGRLPWKAAETIQQFATLQEAADAAARNADVILTWGTTGILAHFQQSAPIVLVGHDTVWRPEDCWGGATSQSSRIQYFAAVSAAAAATLSPPAGPPVSIVYNGADIDRCVPAIGRQTQRTLWRVPHDDLVLTYIGRQSEDKHVRLPADIAHAMGPNCHAVYYGCERGGNIHADLRQLAAIRPKQVHVFPPQDFIGDVLAATDVFVLRSKNEAFSLGINEAWLAGVPVLTNDVGAIPELERKHGKLVYSLGDHETPGSLPNFVRHVAADRDGIADRARKVAWEHYTAKAMARRWEDYLHGLGVRRSVVIRETKQQKLRVGRPLRVAIVCNQFAPSDITTTVQQLFLHNPQLHVVGLVVKNATNAVDPGEKYELHTPLGDAVPLHCQVHETFESAFAAVCATADIVVAHGLLDLDTLIGNSVPIVLLSIGSDDSSWLHTMRRCAVGYITTTDVKIYDDRWRDRFQPVSRETLLAVLSQWSPELPARPKDSPVRALFLCPHLCVGGAEQWMSWLIQNSNTQRLQWVGLVKGHSNIPSDLNIVRNFQKLLPVYLSRTEFDAEMCDTEDIQKTCKIHEDSAALLAAAIQETQPDVIVTYGLGTIAKLIPAAWDKPVVLVSHGDKYCSWTRWISECAAPRATHLVAVSFRAAEVFPEEFQTQATVLYNGVDIQHSTPTRSRAQQRADWGFSDRELLVGFLGRMSLAKDTTAAARAVAHLSEDAWAVLVGESQWNPTIQQQALQHTQRIKKFDVVTNAGNVLSAFDVTVFASKSESFGFVMVESWLCGTPVLATRENIGGEIAAQYGDLFTYVSPDASAAELSQAVQKAVSADNQPRRDLARQIALEQFTAKAMSERWTRYLEQIVNRPAEPLELLNRKNTKSVRDVPHSQGAQHVWCDIVIVVDDITTAKQLITNLLLQQQSTVFFWIFDRTGNSDFHCWLSARCAAHLQVLPMSSEGDLWAATHQLFGRFHTEFLLFPPSTSVPTDSIFRIVTELGNGVEVCSYAGLIGVRVATLIDCGGFNLKAEQPLVDLISRCREELRPVFALQETSMVTASNFSKLAPCWLGDRGAIDVLSREIPQDIDVVLPFFGAYSYVETAIQSIYSQKGMRPHLHLIDDGSVETEQARDLILRHKSEHPEHCVVSGYRLPHNMGQFQAVNAIASRFTSKYLAIQDGDDISFPYRLRYSVACLEASRAHVFGAGMEPFGDFCPEDLSWLFLQSFFPGKGSGHFLANPTLVLRTDVFRLLAGYTDFGQLDRNKASNDSDLCYRLQYGGFRFFMSRRVLVRWRRHSQSCTVLSSTNSSGKARIFTDQEATRRREAYLSAGHCDPSVYGAIAQNKIEVEEL